MKIRITYLTLLSAIVLTGYACEETAPTRPDPIVVKPDPPKATYEEYNIYFGNPHSHSTYSGDVTDKTDTAENIFKTAKDNGYDFYAITDHSQYDTYSLDAWNNLKTQADRYTDETFVGLRGYEHSENNGPDAKGHLNVYNSTTYLNALAEGISMQYFHNWVTLRENSNIVVTMNHPAVNQYDTFHCYNNGAKEMVRLIELINGNNDYHASFLVALSKGWKVAPVAGCDNHNIAGIGKWVPRMGVAAKHLTYDDIIGAMHARRTFATFDSNLHVMYYVNNFDMGMEINPEGDKLDFHIVISDPDTSIASNKITKVEIIGVNNELVAHKDFDSYEVVWDTKVEKTQAYYYLKVYNASKTTPIAYAAPVWVKLP